MNPTIALCGAGGIGRAAALILACNDAMTPTIYIGDISELALRETIQWIDEGKTNNVHVEPFLMPLKGASREMDVIFNKSDVILDCLPGSQAPRIAKMARDHYCHYANLTEYVVETNEIIEMAKESTKGFLLQTGLAPGYINVLACQLYNEFQDKYKNDKIESVKMRVGALSENVTGPYYYAYTWSPIGVATEYVKDAVVVKNGKEMKVPSLSRTERIIINGEHFEDNYTSGGSADLTTAFKGKVKDLDYKTLRYPGHYDWVKSCLIDISGAKEDPRKLDQYMQARIPAVESDRVVIFAQVKGYDQNNVLRGIERSFNIIPSLVGNKKLRAIQSTTASALCEAAYFLLNNNPTGPILQSDINPLVFLNGPFVSSVYGTHS
jgi:saccharopine dehydrogenase-like NADP-dependent oxidoreductase